MLRILLRATRYFVPSFSPPVTRRLRRFRIARIHTRDIDRFESYDSCMKEKTKGGKSEPVLESWLELDLTEATRRGELSSAFEVDDLVDTVFEVVSAGRRPVLTGSPGSGKTSVVHGCARRALLPAHSGLFGSRRILKLSLRRKAASLKNPDQIRPEFLKLIEELRAKQDRIIPYFSDFHLAYQFGLEPQFCALSLRIEGPILCEGDLATTEMMIQYEPELDQHYVTIPVVEPDFDRVKRIAIAWAAEETTRVGTRLSDDAVDEAAHLAFRFLSRSSPLRKTIDLLSHAATLSESNTVTATDVIDRFSASCRVPRVLVDPAVPLDVESLEATFRDRVLGQEEAVRSVIGRIGIIKAGLSDLRRPFAAFLFAGPTGVGKTHLAQLLAEYLFGSRDRVLRFNMADYQGDSGGELLFGNPDGHNLAQMRGQLTLRVLSHPFGVLLLDEFEKAHAKVHDRFFQLMDEGCFINGARETVSCRSMIIIATSNAGAEAFRNPPLGFEGRIADGNLREHLERKLLDIFRTEFLNRFDEIVYFHPLRREHVRTIARRELDAPEKRSGLTQRQYSLDIDESILDWLAAHGYDPRHGARFLRRTLERTVTGTLAKTIVRAPLEAGTRIRLAVRGGRVAATVVLDKPPADNRVPVTLPMGNRDVRRRMNRGELEAEWKRLKDAAGIRTAEMDARIRQRDALIAAMNEPSFWNDPASSRTTLEQFRDLDVTIQCEKRLADALSETLSSEFEKSLDVDQIVERVERAGILLAEWQERLSPDASSSIWLIVSAHDSREPASEWIEELAEMECGWCRQSGLTVEPVAYAMHDGKLARAAFFVDGPGAEAYLRMEEGLHRRTRSEGGDWKARMEIVPVSSPEADFSGRLSDARQHTGAFGMRVSKRGRLELRGRGMILEFFGAREEAMNHLLADLERAWMTAPREEPAVARIYGRDGTGGVDPRTGASVPRIKSVLKGDLDTFLDGWRNLALQQER